MSENKDQSMCRRRDLAQVVMMAVLGFLILVMILSLMSIWGGYFQNHSNETSDGGVNYERQTVSPSSDAPVPAESSDIRTADWKGVESIDSMRKHLALECPYCLTANEYPATTCRGCGKSYHIKATYCGVCDGTGKLQCGTKSDPWGCRGTGKLGDRRIGEYTCPLCNGTNRVKCYFCRGRGRFEPD